VCKERDTTLSKIGRWMIMTSSSPTQISTNSWTEGRSAEVLLRVSMGETTTCLNLTSTLNTTPTLTEMKECMAPLIPTPTPWIRKFEIESGGEMESESESESKSKSKSKASKAVKAMTAAMKGEYDEKRRSEEKGESERRSEEKGESDESVSESESESESESKSESETMVVIHQP
jgi:hypothetical protein